ncbi:hypothetical protein D3C76_1346530 [compost metagenome]
MLHLLLVGQQPLDIDHLPAQAFEPFDIEPGRDILVPGRLQQLDSFGNRQVAVERQVVRAGRHTQALARDRVAQTEKLLIAELAHLQAKLGKVHRL